jgi:L-ribulose-5-phosphate 4-epimerase
MLVEELRKDICEANRDLVRHKLVILTWGNVSGIDREKGLIVIKPSGLAYSELTPASMAVLDLAGKVVEGDLRPSSDAPTHVVLYNEFPTIGDITHTHSRYATVFAQACRPIPCLGTTHADHFRGEVPITRDLRKPEMDGHYEAATGSAIVEKFVRRDPLEMPAVLVAHHGPFTWGLTASGSVVNSIVLEEVARIALETLALAPNQPPISSYLLDRHFFRKHGPDAYYGQK